MSRYLASVAGATLGYIGGNIPGAVAGGSLGYKYGGNNLTKNKMLTPSSYGRKRRRSSVSTAASYRPRGRVRRGSLASLMSALSSTTSRRSSVARPRRVVHSNRTSKSGSRHDDLGVVVRSKRSKGTKATGTKRLKVSKDFRKKVTQSLEGKKGVGFMKEVISMKFGTAIADNEQAVGYLSDELDGSKGLFSPMRVLDAAAVLFNRKALARVKVLGNQEFPVTYTKVNVLKQWCTFTLSNQTQRTKTITIFEANQKGAAAVPYDPLLAWAEAYSLDALDTLYTGTNTDFQGPNLNSMGRTFLGCEPNSLKAFRKDYHVSSKKIILEPGQTHSFTVQGDSGLYDYAKYHVGTTATLTENTNRTKWVFYAIHNDLVVTSAGITGRFETVSPAVLRAVICEYTYNYRIECPEQTGFKPGTTFSSGPQILNNIKDAYAMVNYSAAQGGGTINRIDDNDPSVPESGV